MTVFSVLNSLLYCEPVEKSKQRSDLVRYDFCFRSCLFLFVFQNEASNIDLTGRRLWTEEAGRPERRELQQPRCDRMSEVNSFTVASVERYFRLELIGRG